MKVPEKKRRKKMSLTRLLLGAYGKKEFLFFVAPCKDVHFFFRLARLHITLQFFIGSGMLLHWKPAKIKIELENEIWNVQKEKFKKRKTCSWMRSREVFPSRDGIETWISISLVSLEKRFSRKHRNESNTLFDDDGYEQLIRHQEIPFIFSWDFYVCSCESRFQCAA